MNVSDALSTLRTDYLYDVEEPYLWSDMYLLRLLSLAESEAARRAGLIRDTTNATASDIFTGSATSTTADKLVNSGATFTSATVGKTVYNTTDNTWTTVTALDSTTQLSLTDDIMASGEAYIIGTPAQALTRVCLTSGTGQYTTSAKITKIDGCRMASDMLPLEQKTEAWLDDNYYQWRLATGKPVFYVERKGSIQVVPAPDANINSGTGVDTLLLDVFRLPLVTFTTANADTESFEIDDEYHFGLLDWAAHLAYNKQDSHTYDANRAAAHAAAFASKFGQPVSALLEENMRILPAHFTLRTPQW
jgi:hypothetical protein